VTEVWYCAREDVLGALDVPEASWRYQQIDRLIQGSSRGIEGDLGRYFYPLVSTQTFDWPDHQFSLPWRYWLDQRELLSVTQVLAAGQDITASVMLRPDDAPMRGRPYTKIEIDLSTSAAFTSGATYQRAIIISGTFGYCQGETPAGTVAAFTDTTSTSATVSNAALVGVGNILRVDAERMHVTDRAMATTTATITGPLTALNNNNTIPVSNGALLNQGETIQVDAEQMLITSIIGNNVTVERAWGGTVLAAHTTNTTVNAARLLTVTRAALGTTAATHTANAPINVHLVPPLIRELCVAETLAALGQERRGYTTIVKRSSNPAPGDPLEISMALDDLRRRAAARYRRVRTRTAARSI
jgi:hypothetical protein